MAVEVEHEDLLMPVVHGEVVTPTPAFQEESLYLSHSHMGSEGPGVDWTESANIHTLLLLVPSLPAPLPSFSPETSETLALHNPS
jgi:hypothetical protein